MDPEPPVPNEDEDVMYHIEAIPADEYAIRFREVNVIIPPRVIPITLGNNIFAVIMRCVEVDPGDIMWEARLHIWGAFPEGWEPVNLRGPRSSG